MKLKRRQWEARSLLFGMAAGAGAALLGNHFMSRNADKRPSQLLVNRALDSRLRQSQRENRIPLNSDHRYVIFSDHHKGARTLADPFQQCEETYLAALEHYYDSDFTLIILGDGEELLEESIEAMAGRS